MPSRLGGRRSMRIAAVLPLAFRMGETWVSSGRGESTGTGSPDPVPWGEVSGDSERGMPRRVGLAGDIAVWVVVSLWELPLKAARPAHGR